MMLEKMTEAHTPTIQLGATPSGLISDPHPSSPSPISTPDALPAATIPIFPWDRYEICWSAYLVAWLWVRIRQRLIFIMQTITAERMAIVSLDLLML